MFKRITFFSALLLVFIMSGFAFAQISFSPEYGDERFEPIDQYHAECLSTMHFGLDMKNVEDVEQLYLVLHYNADDLQIIQLKGIYQGTYTVGSDKIIIDFDRSLDLASDEEGDKDTLFAQVQFKSKKNISSGKFIINEASYYVTNKGEKIFIVSDRDKEDKEDKESEEKIEEFAYGFDFVEVPECEPDIIAPSIELLSPQNKSTGQALDTYFVFDVKDAGKGINKKSFSLEMNNVTYDTSDKQQENMFKRSGSYLFFFPDTWLPVDQEVSLEVRVADLQEYGNPNRVEESFEIHTASGVLLKSEVNPNMMRLFNKKTQELVASSSECASLNQFYAESDIYNKYKLKGVMDKLNCEVSNNLEVVVLSDLSGVSANINIDISKTNEEDLSKNRYFSVFAIFGWLLFVVTLLLKFHYIHSSAKYKKRHKKLEKKLENSVGF